MSLGRRKGNSLAREEEEKVSQAMLWNDGGTPLIGPWLTLLSFLTARRTFPRPGDNLAGGTTHKSEKLGEKTDFGSSVGQNHSFLQFF